MSEPEARLWHAILAHALHDAATGKDAGWIGSRDFHEVCNLAGLDAEAVETRFEPKSFATLSGPPDGTSIAEILRQSIDEPAESAKHGYGISRRA